MLVYICLQPLALILWLDIIHGNGIRVHQKMLYTDVFLIKILIDVKKSIDSSLKKSFSS